MVYQLPAVTALIPDKGPVLALAAKLLHQIEMGKLASNVDPKLERAKRAAYQAYSETLRQGLFGDIRDALQRVLELQEVLDCGREDADDVTAWDATLDASVATELAPLQALYAEGFTAKAQGVALHEVGRVDEVAQGLAAMVAKCEPYHFELNGYGKALAAVGIVADDLTGLAVLVSDEAVEASREALDAAAVAQAQAPAPQPVAAPPGGAATVDMRPPPSNVEIAGAYKLMYDAAGVDAATVAADLKISRNTFVNWCTGKVVPKCTSEQAAYLREVCESVAADMTTAATIFSRVR